MSKVLKTVAVVAGVIAIAATGGAALAGAGTILGMSAATLTTVATIASVTAAVTSTAAQFLTKPPPGRGSVAQTVIDPNAPRPYVMGEGYVGGVRRYDRAYGPTLNKIPNPYRYIVDVYCGHGPVETLTPRFDFQPINSTYYSGFLSTSRRFGNCPETTALVPFWDGAPNWDADSKLSGCAAVGWSFKFDKDQKRFASGIPVMGAYGKWVKVYDPRLDSTYPGGLGSHRLGNESTYTWSENPALHFAMYAYGRFQNGRKVIGVGLPADGIDWPVIAAWANVCDANGWKIFGRAFEPGDRWGILKDIAAAGGGVPVFSGGMLSATFSAPRVSLGTITYDDLAEGDASVTKAQTYSSRINTMVPKFIDPGSNWELMPAEAVSYPALVTEDGEERRQEFPFNFVKSATQAAQLASYKVLSSREQSPIVLPLLPQWRMARPGECYTLDLPELDLSGDAIVLKREIDPSTFTVKLTFAMETASKHTVALGTVGVPAVPVSGTQTSDVRDDTLFAANDSNTVTASMSPSSATVFAYANGNIVSLSPASGQIRVFEGNANVTASAIYAVTGQTNCTGTVNTAGQYALTSMTAETASLSITATYAGKTVPLTLNVTKSYVGYEIADILPTDGNFDGRIAYSNGKLWRYVGTSALGAWTAAVPAVDVTGTITSTQIADDAITTPKLAANAVTAAEIAANAIISDKISAGAITAAKLATTELITLSAQIGSAVVTNAKIADLAVDTLKIAGNAVTLPLVYTGSDIYVVNAIGNDGSGGYTAVSSGNITVGDTNGGGLLVVFYATIDASLTKDPGVYFILQVDKNDGLGFQNAVQTLAGVRTAGGDTYYVMPVALTYSVMSGQTVSVRVKVGNRSISSGVAGNIPYLRNITMSVLGAKR